MTNYFLFTSIDLFKRVLIITLHVEYSELLISLPEL